MVVSTRSNTKRDSSFEREANDHKLGSWDQFQANKDLVKGASTYAEELYTTPLPPYPSPESTQRADEIAISITNSREGATPDTGHAQPNSEEQLFSRVRPTEQSDVQSEEADSSTSSSCPSGFRFLGADDPSPS